MALTDNQSYSLWMRCFSEEATDEEKSAMASEMYSWNDELFTLLACFREGRVEESPESPKTDFAISKAVLRRWSDRKVAERKAKEAVDG